jgi:phosphatidylglycerophosphatase C
MKKRSFQGGRDASRVYLGDQLEDAGVVAFDFDGTLTVRDSFTAFLKWRVSPGRYLLGMVRLVPAAVAYLGHRNRGRIKAAAVREFLKGLTRDQLEAQARAFAEAEAPHLLRPDAVQAWRGGGRAGAARHRGGPLRPRPGGRRPDRHGTRL